MQGRGEKGKKLQNGVLGPTHTCRTLQSQRQVKGKSQISYLYFMNHDTFLATHLCLKDRKEKEIRVCTCYVAVQLLLGTTPFNFSIKLSGSYANQIDIL